jgi:hypothetical protein
MKILKLIVRIIFFAIAFLVFFAIAGGFEKPIEALIGMGACAVAVGGILGSYRLLIWAFLE